MDNTTLSQPQKIPESRQDSQPQQVDDYTQQVPAEIHVPPVPGRHPGGAPSKYTPNTAILILTLIQTTNTPVKQVCNIAGINQDAWYRWIGASQQLHDSYLRAMASRQYVKCSESSEDVTKLMQLIEESDIDPREKHVRIQGLRLKLEHNRWVMSKYNRAVFGDKQQIEQKQINVHVVASPEEVKHVPGAIEDLLLPPDTRGK